jgi:hypothetical protein
VTSHTVVVQLQLVPAQKSSMHVTECARVWAPESPIAAPSETAASMHCPSQTALAQSQSSRVQTSWVHDVTRERVFVLPVWLLPLPLGAAAACAAVALVAQMPLVHARDDGACADTLTVLLAEPAAGGAMAAAMAKLASRTPSQMPLPVKRLILGDLHMHRASHAGSVMRGSAVSIVIAVLG